MGTHSGIENTSTSVRFDPELLALIQQIPSIPDDLLQSEITVSQTEELVKLHTTKLVHIIKLCKLYTQSASKDQIERNQKIIAHILATSTKQISQSSAAMRPHLTQISIDILKQFYTTWQLFVTAFRNVNQSSVSLKQVEATKSETSAYHQAHNIANDPAHSPQVFAAMTQLAFSQPDLDQVDAMPIIILHLLRSGQLGGVDGEDKTQADQYCQKAIAKAGIDVDQALSWLQKSDSQDSISEPSILPDGLDAREVKTAIQSMASSFDPGQEQSQLIRNIMQSSDFSYEMCDLLRVSLHQLADMAIDITNTDGSPDHNTAVLSQLVSDVRSSSAKGMRSGLLFLQLCLQAIKDKQLAGSLVQAVDVQLAYINRWLDYGVEHVQVYGICQDIYAIAKKTGLNQDEPLDSLRWQEFWQTIPAQQRNTLLAAGIVQRVPQSMLQKGLSALVQFINRRGYYAQPARRHERLVEAGVEKVLGQSYVIDPKWRGLLLPQSVPVANEGETVPVAK